MALSLAVNNYFLVASLNSSFGLTHLIRTGSSATHNELATAFQSAAVRSNGNLPMVAIDDATIPAVHFAQISKALLLNFITSSPNVDVQIHLYVQVVSFYSSFCTLSPSGRLPHHWIENLVCHRELCSLQLSLPFHLNYL